MPTGPEWDSLSDYVRRRRVAMGYSTQKALMEATGLSLRVIQKIEHGQSVSWSTLAAVEVALDWRAGSARSILAGGEPQIEPSADQKPPVVRNNWNDPNVQLLWNDLRVDTDAQKLALVMTYLAGKRSRGSRGPADREPTSL